MRRCPLWVKSRHQRTFGQCPLYPRKRTLVDDIGRAQMVLKCVECLIKDRDALLTFYDFPAEPPAISGGLGLEHPSGSVTRL